MPLEGYTVHVPRVDGSDVVVKYFPLNGRPSLQVRSRALTYAKSVNGRIEAYGVLSEKELQLELSRIKKYGC
jgi:hypothetical protein